MKTDAVELRRFYLYRKLDEGWTLRFIRSFPCALVLSFILASALNACVSTQKEEGSPMLTFHSPPGAAMPEGVDRIREGMTRDDIQGILGSTYSSPPGTSGRAALRPYSWVDVFRYSIGEVPSEIRVVYIGNEVAEVHYGIDLRTELE